MRQGEYTSSSDLSIHEILLWSPFHTIFEEYIDKMVKL